MSIVCQANDSHDMSRLIFNEKKKQQQKTKYLKVSSAANMIGALRVKYKSYILLLECVGILRYMRVIIR